MLDEVLDDCRVEGWVEVLKDLRGSSGGHDARFGENVGFYADELARKSCMRVSNNAL